MIPHCLVKHLHHKLTYHPGLQILHFTFKIHQLITDEKGTLKVIDYSMQLPPVFIVKKTYCFEMQINILKYFMFWK